MAAIGETPLFSTKATAPRRRTVIVSGVALAAVAVGAAFILSPRSEEQTDDAYLAADATAVAPRVSGLVGQVLVADNQPVSRGDPLIRIEPEEFDARVAEARANLVDGQAAVEAARAALASLDAEEQLAFANVEATRTTIRTASAEVDKATADRRRFDKLATTGAVSLQDVDLYRTAAVRAEQGAAQAHALLVVSQRQASVTTARRATLRADLARAGAQALRAQAALDLALLDQRHTLVRAPIDGVVGARQARVGDYVQPGTRLLTLVPLHAVYVTANFKETQTRRMRPGQAAIVHVDATGRNLTGRVESFAPGSGSTFSLLPFEPGVGNFTKIVQRVPVRIHFDADQDGVAGLRPGLSVTAKVALKN